MLIKYSLKALLISGAVATVGNAQAPLWFDANDSSKAASATASATPAKSQHPVQSTPANAQQASGLQSTLPQAAASAQPSLWFNAAPWDAKWERKLTPELKPSSVPSWVEANKVTATAQATDLPTPASRPAPTTGSLAMPAVQPVPAKTESPNPTSQPPANVAAPTTWFSLAEAMKSQGKAPANAAKATTSNSVKNAFEVAVKNAVKHTVNNSGSNVASDAAKSESVDTFIARAEAQLRLQDTASKQVAAPALPLPEQLLPEQLLPEQLLPEQLLPEQPSLNLPALNKPSFDTLSASESLRSADEAKVTKPEVSNVVFGREVSTRLTSRALQSGEVESGFRWPRQTPEPSPTTAYSTVTASGVKVAEESLVPPMQTALAIWQLDDDEKSVAGDKQESEAEEVPNASTSAMSDAMKDAKKPAKFQTESMVGPMTHAGQLFSMLDLTDRFQSYAEPVASARTRDLDSPMHAPYTFENYTWISPVFYHKPLYFEQPNLERYGQGAHRYLQPAASSIHFFGTIPLLPYKVLTQHPCEKHYTLGNRRPGNCNPYQRRVILGQSTVGEIREYWRDGSGY